MGRFSENGRRKGERGNALLYVFIAIAVLALLTFAVSDTSDNTDNIADYAVADEQIARILAYSGTIAATLNEMVIAGATHETLYSTLVTTPPGGAGFGTAPHNMKIFHPMGGGLNYISSSGSATDTDTVGTSFKINPGSIVDDVGPTDAVVGDILFTAVINDVEACQRINFLLRGDGTVPVLATASFDNLFTTGAAVTIDAANCADCVGVAQACVSNTAGDAWGFYAALLPG